MSKRARIRIEISQISQVFDLTSKATPPKSGNFKTNINKTKRKQII